MPVIRAAAAAEHGELRHALAQVPVMPGEIDRIAGIEFRRFIELRMALRRGVGAQAADAPHPCLACGQRIVEMSRMRTVDHVVDRRMARLPVRALDGGSERLAGSQSAIRLDRERDHRGPRAIPIALAITLVVYLCVAVAVLQALGADALAAATDPLAQAVAAVGFGGLEPVVRVAAVIAALGSLLALILGVSRTTFAMARDGNLPRLLDAVHPRFAVPYRAELAVGVVVALLAATADLRGVIGFSSFAVLVYYLIANASAWTLSAKPWSRLVAVVGAVGCVVLAAFLPLASVISGVIVLGVGAVIYGIRSARRT